MQAVFPFATFFAHFGTSEGLLPGAKAEALFLPNRSNVWWLRLVDKAVAGMWRCGETSFGC